MLIAELKKIIITSKNMFLHFYSHSHPHVDRSLSWSVDEETAYAGDFGSKQ